MIRIRIGIPNEIRDREHLSLFATFNMNEVYLSEMCFSFRCQLRHISTRLDIAGTARIASNLVEFMFMPTTDPLTKLENTSALRSIRESISLEFR